MKAMKSLQWNNITEKKYRKVISLSIRSHSPAKLKLTKNSSSTEIESECLESTIKLRIQKSSPSQGLYKRAVANNFTKFTGIICDGVPL